MRRLFMVAALVSLLVMVFAGVALARNFQCTERSCEGTDNADTIFERGGDGIGDAISGMRGPDRIFADRFTNDADQLSGGRGADELDADDGDDLDTLNGGSGNNDTCSGDAGDEFIGCETIFIDDVEQVPAP